jgi:hypothetical protein
LPALLDYEGPPLQGIERPEFPKNLDQLDKVERARCVNNWRDMTLAAYYRTLLHKTNKRLYHAIEFQETTSYELLTYARNILIDGEIIFLDQVVEELQEIWDTLTGVKKLGNPPFPFEFSEEERAGIAPDYQDMTEGMKCMREIEQGIRELFPCDITASHENYELAKRTFGEYKEVTRREFARNEEERDAVRAWWPFEWGGFGVL